MKFDISSRNSMYLYYLKDERSFYFGRTSTMSRYPSRIPFLGTSNIYPTWQKTYYIDGLAQSNRQKNSQIKYLFKDPSLLS